MVLLTVESRLALDWCLFTIFFSTVLFRFWVIRRMKYSRFSARGLASIFIVMVVISCLPNYINNTWIAVQQLKYRDMGYREMGIPFGVPPDHTLITILKMLYSANYQYFCVLWFVKASFLALYFEVTTHLPTRVKLCLYAATVFTFVTFMILIIGASLWCSPVSRNWAIDTLVYCAPLRHKPFVYLSTFLNVFNDLLIMFIGCYILYGVKLRRRGIAAASFIIFLGCVTIFMAFFRMALILRSIDHPAETFDLTDFSLIFSEVEGVVAGCAACLPALRVYVRRTSESPNHSENSNQLSFISRVSGKDESRRRLNSHDSGSTDAINQQDPEYLRERNMV